MKTAHRSTLVRFLILAIALAACGGETEEPQANVEAEADTGNDTPAATSASEACPPEAEIVAIVGQPVQSKPGGGMCFYESADFTASVTIMRITAGQADQLDQEMRASAEPYGAELEAIDVGDRGQVWGSPGYGQGYAIEGGSGWLLDVNTPPEDGDRRTTVVQLLERMIEG